MSGLVTAAVATAKTFGLIDPQKVGETQTWWLAAGLSIVSAMALAWNDERHRADTLDRERSGPRLSLEFNPSEVPGWSLANQGTDAFNVVSEPIRYGRRSAKVVPVPKIPHSGHRFLSFDLYREDGDLLAPKVLALDHLFRAVLDDKTIPDSEFQEEIALPAVFRYMDDAGRKFETACELRWDLNTKRGEVIHKWTRLTPPAPWYQVLKQRLLDRE
jgi:hypothetical protein